jgi:hypothetical protein
MGLSKELCLHPFIDNDLNVAQTDFLQQIPHKTLSHQAWHVNYVTWIDGLLEV